MKRYQDYVSAYHQLLQDTELPLFDDDTSLPLRAPFLVSENAPSVMIFSPHPDDESINGLLPLRLMQESGFIVNNIAVTLGSDVSRQAARWQEVKRACQYLGFNVLNASEKGLKALTLDIKANQPHIWQSYIAILSDYVQQFKPEMVIFPHQEDRHPTHCATHALVMDVLKATRHVCWVWQTEFWQPMRAPNVMLACRNEDLSHLMIALACHRGEVARNPYHLRLPSWMADNVRRGTELIFGNQAAASPYAFATLYRVDKWNGGELLTHSYNYNIAENESLLLYFNQSHKNSENFC